MKKTKVFKRNDKHFNTTLHAVFTLDYHDGRDRFLVRPYVKTWCGKELWLTDKDKYTEFIRSEHKDSLCIDCKEAISIHYRRKERDHHAGKHAGKGELGT